MQQLATSKLLNLPVFTLITTGIIKKHNTMVARSTTNALKQTRTDSGNTPLMFLFIHDVS